MSYENQGFLLTALQHGTIYFGRHGFNTTLYASTTFILSANPTGSSGNWRDKEKIGFNNINKQQQTASYSTSTPRRIVIIMSIST